MPPPTEPLPHEQCLTEENFRLPSVTELPIELLQIPAEHLESATALASAWVGPPIEALLGGIAFSALLFLRLPQSSVLRLSLRAGRGAALVLLFAPWCVLVVADFHRARDEHLRTAEILRATEGLFEPLSASWIRNPARSLLEANLIEGVDSALRRGDVPTALSLAEWPSVETAEGSFARSAAFIGKASEALQSGHPAIALRYARLAKTAVSSEAAREAEHRSLFHLGVDQARSGQLDEAHSTFRALDSSWNPEMSADLLALIAHERVGVVLSKAEIPLDEAREILEGAWEIVVGMGVAPSRLVCDIAAVYELAAQLNYERGDPSRAVEFLAQAERFVSEAPVVLSLYPRALLARGREEVARSSLVQATETLEEADRRWVDDDRSSLWSSLELVWQLRSREALKESRFDEALGFMESADGYSGGANRTRDAIAEIRLARARDLSRSGNWSAARADLEASRERPRFRAEATRYLKSLHGAAERVRGICRTPRWIDVSCPTGEVAVDSDSNGTSDLYYYYRGGTRPIAYSKTTQIERVNFLRSGRVGDVIEDRNDDGAFDALTTFGDNGLSVSVIDLDSDHRPDVRAVYEANRLVEERAISGNVQMRFGMVCLDGEADVWSAPDLFFMVYRNESHLFRSRVIGNSNCASFYEGVTVRYRWEDEVRVHLWDEDLIWDDPLDQLAFHDLPRTGTYKMLSKRALMDIEVRPSTMPHGHAIHYEPSPRDFAFWDRVHRVPDFGELVASAKEREERAAVKSKVAKVALSEAIAFFVFRRSNLAVRLGVSDVIEETLLDPLFPSPQ